MIELHASLFVSCVKRCLRYDIKYLSQLVYLLTLQKSMCILTLFFFLNNYNEEYAPSILDMVFQHKIHQDWCMIWGSVLYIVTGEFPITLLKFVRQGWLLSHLIFVICLCSTSNIGNVAQCDYRWRFDRIFFTIRQISH